MGIPTSVYYRPADEAGVDGHVTLCDEGHVLVECKAQWASEIDSPCLAKIVSRCAGYHWDAKLILVICGTLQRKYTVEEGTWAAETSFLRVEMDGVVACVDGIPKPSAPKRVLVLVAVNSSKKSKRVRRRESGPPRKKIKNLLHTHAHAVARASRVAATSQHKARR